MRGGRENRKHSLASRRSINEEGGKEEKAESQERVKRGNKNDKGVGEESEEVSREERRPW